MPLTVTAWRLADPDGKPAYCTITQRDYGWQLAVRRDSGLIIAEHCPSDEAALNRATEIWSVLVDQGWTEPRH
jgi:hypothetical protein